MTENIQPDSPGSLGRTQTEEIRSLRSKLAKLEQAKSEYEDLGEICHALIDNSVQGLAIIQDGRMVFANRSMEAITGYSVEQLQAMAPEELQVLVHPEDRHAVWTRHRDRLADEKLQNPYEFRGIHKDGRVRWLRLYAGRILYHGRAAVQAAYVDVTDQKHVQEALCQSEARFRQLIENLADGVFAHDLEGRLVMVNEMACRNTGYNRDELLSMTVADVDLDSDVQKDWAGHWRSLPVGPTVQLDRVHRRKDGSTYPVEVRLNRLDLQGQPIILAVARDVTERQRDAQTIALSERRHRALFERAPIGIGLAELGGRPIAANKAMEDLFGYSMEELKHLDVSDLYEHPNDRMALLKQVQENGQVRDYPTQMRRKDGSLADILRRR